MSNPPLPSYDQELLDKNGITIDIYGGFLYKGVYIVVAYNLEVKAYYYIVKNINKYGYVWSLEEAFKGIDSALAKLDKIGEPWD